MTDKTQKTAMAVREIPGSLSFGTKRSQVQILSPRLGPQVQSETPVSDGQQDRREPAYLVAGPHTGPQPAQYRAFKYRLWTNANQERELAIMLETHRRLYNEMLAMRIASWECDRVSIGFYFQSWCLKGMRRANPYYARLNYASAEQTMRRLDRSYQNFFRRVKSGEAKAGFPRFKGKGRFESIEFKYPVKWRDGIRLTGDRLYVQHVGTIRVKLHRPYEGKIKTARLKLEGDKWFLVLSCDLGAVAVPKSTNPPVGIDMGLESFLTTSDGEQEPNPRFQKEELPVLRLAGRAVSRKKKGGSNRRKAVKRLRLIHNRVANLRHDHSHKTALKLVRRYGHIGVESLTVRNMVKNRSLARSISDAGWSGFLSTLKAKAESAGVEVVEVNAAYTSQICSECGQIVEKTLKERWHSCECGCSLDRDVNAARNILARSLARTEPAGRNVDPRSSVPREADALLCRSRYERSLA